VAAAGLAHPRGLTDLAFLNLEFTRVTDAGLAHLKGPTKLTNLVLTGAQIMEKGARELQQALPNLKISRAVDPKAILVEGMVSWMDKPHWQEVVKSWTSVNNPTARACHDQFEAASVWCPRNPRTCRRSLKAQSGTMGDRLEQLRFVQS
jgi:hypothetical protein